MQVRCGWVVVVLAGCGPALATAQPAQEQPSIVVQAAAPSPPPAAPQGDIKECTLLVGTIREIVEEVSVAYNDHERTHDFATFERTVRTCGDKAVGLGLRDTRLQGIAARYRDALLHEVQAMRHTETAVPLSQAASQEEGRGAVAQEGELLDELNAYCGWQARQEE
jgi:hypothetical protein